MIRPVPYDLDHEDGIAPTEPGRDKAGRRNYGFASRAPVKPPPWAGARPGTHPLLPLYPPTREGQRRRSEARR